MKCPRCGGPGGTDNTYGHNAICRACHKAGVMARRRHATDNPYLERLVQLLAKKPGRRPREYADALGLDTYDHRLRAARDTLVHEGRLVVEGTTHATRWWPKDSRRKAG